MKSVARTMVATYRGIYGARHSWALHRSLSVLSLLDLLIG